MTDNLRHHRKRTRDGREWVFNAIFGGAFWGCMAGSVAERMGYLETGLFTILFASLLMIVIVSVCFILAFLVYVGFRHLKANWNDRTELLSAGTAIGTALKRMNIVSLLGFVCIICICFYVNLPLLGMGLGGGVLVMLLTVALLYQIGNMRADKL